jgi:hypothetical protein
MELADIIQNGGLVLSGAALVKLGGIAAKVWAARNGKTEVANDPLNIRKEDKFVTRGEFNRYCEDNARDHENMFARLNRNDILTSEINGKLAGIKEDLTLIKQKLLRMKM